MDSVIKKVLVTEEEIDKKVKELGREITRDYQGKDLMLVGILKGAVVFMSDLMRAIDRPVFIDFMDVSSYGSSSISTGNVKIIKDLDYDIENKHILIVEDIIDTGQTLAYLKDNLTRRGAKSVKVCAFLDKADRRLADVPIDYCGFSIPDEFIVGYGLDYAEKYRNFPYIGALKEEAYS